MEMADEGNYRKNYASKNRFSRLTSKNRKSQKSTFSGECLVSEKRRKMSTFILCQKKSNFKMSSFEIFLKFF